MRIVAGSARGRRLQAPGGSGTRPTSDRAREGLFSSLQSLLELDGARVWDLYAGSGALGLEALSRGAAQAVLVECDPVAAQACRANTAAVGLPGAQVVVDRVERFLQRPASAEVDLALLDPPYAVAVEDVLAALVPHLAPGAAVAVERSCRGAAPRWPDGVRQVRSRRYGEAVLWYGSRS